MTFEATPAFAAQLDSTDPLKAYRQHFHIPEHEGKPVAYFCGNSLGLQPKQAAEYMQEELNDWATMGVEGHFRAKRPWFSYHHLFTDRLAAVVGALPTEVVAMNQLTVNLHLLMLSFYRPTATRYKIIMEAGAFPSDQYAIASQAMLHGFDPNTAIIEIAPREGSYTIAHEDILQAIADAGDTLALVLFGGVNYYTGQLFDMAGITAAAHAVGAYCGFDLAHAAGNASLSLHNWGVDFACWCSYKYLNAGPGAVGGAYIHEKHATNPHLFRLTGWWGNDETTRFAMKKQFIVQQSAGGWQMSNAPVMNMVALHASLNIFAECGMPALAAKRTLMNQYIDFLFSQLNNKPFEIITPTASHQRGCQLSLLFNENGKKIFEQLTQKGIIADWREPNVIRIAPVPLYNTYTDIYTFYAYISEFGLSEL
ncbi:MAG: kynureninase [Chitinophagia bacterium]|nr:kynureninase [Chitinophagia bacterium]